MESISRDKLLWSPLLAGYWRHSSLLAASLKVIALQSLQLAWHAWSAMAKHSGRNNRRSCKLSPPLASPNSLRGLPELKGCCIILLAMNQFYSGHAWSGVEVQALQKSECNVLTPPTTSSSMLGCDYSCAQLCFHAHALSCVSLLACLLVPTLDHIPCMVSQVF